MGRFVHIAAHQVEVHRWDRDVEDMLPDDAIAPAERERLINGVLRMQFDERLGPYPSEQLEQWQQLCNFITPAVLQRLNSPSQRISSLADALPAGMSDVPERDTQRPNVVSRNAAVAAAAADADRRADLPKFDGAETKTTRASALLITVSRQSGSTH